MCGVASTRIALGHVKGGRERGLIWDTVPAFGKAFFPHESLTIFFVTSHLELDKWRRKSSIFWEAYGGVLVGPFSLCFKGIWTDFWKAGCLAGMGLGMAFQHNQMENCITLFFCRSSLRVRRWSHTYSPALHKEIFIFIILWFIIFHWNGNTSPNRMK